MTSTKYENISYVVMRCEMSESEEMITNHRTSS